MSNPKYYVVEVIGGIEPFLRGPLDTVDDQERVAKMLHAAQDPDTDATFWLDINAEGVPEIGSYSGQFFEGEDNDG